MTPSIVREYNITVSGTGQFPIDMLRYDRCTPHHEEDAATIERSFRPRERGLCTVTLLAAREPTTARWESYDWAVEEVTFRR